MEKDAILEHTEKSLRNIWLYSAARTILVLSGAVFLLGSVLLLHSQFMPVEFWGLGWFLFGIAIVLLELSTKNFLRRHELLLGITLVLVSFYWLFLIVLVSFSSGCVPIIGIQTPVYCAQVRSAISSVGDLAAFVTGIGLIVMSFSLHKRNVKYQFRNQFICVIQ